LFTIASGQVKKINKEALFKQKLKKLTHQVNKNVLFTGASGELK